MADEPDKVEEESVDDFMQEFEDVDVDIEMLLPSKTVTQDITPPKEECIIKDNELLDLYDEILDDCRKDREEADSILANFLDMVMNEGDASSASKEAIVNLFKIKSDISDKKTKVADLKTRIKLKDRDTFPRYLAQNTNAKIVVEDSKRELIKSVNKLMKGQIKGQVKNDKSS